MSFNTLQQNEGTRTLKMFLVWNWRDWHRKKGTSAFLSLLQNLMYYNLIVIHDLSFECTSDLRFRSEEIIIFLSYCQECNQYPKNWDIFWKILGVTWNSKIEIWTLIFKSWKPPITCITCILLYTPLSQILHVNLVLVRNREILAISYR